MVKVLVRDRKTGRGVLVPAHIAQSILTTRSRAPHLHKQGYKIEPVDAPNGLFFVSTGKVVSLSDGTNAEGYLVNVVERTCQCWQFATSNTHGVAECKHLLWLTPLVEFSLRTLGLWPQDKTFEEALQK
jgi:hypothetical protein